MPKIRVKREALAERCEICHQADCYDPLTNYCSRCGDAAAQAATLKAEPSGFDFSLLSPFAFPASYLLIYGSYLGIRVYYDSIIPFRYKVIMDVWQALPIIESAFLLFALISLRKLWLVHKNSRNAKTGADFGILTDIAFWLVSLLTLLNALCVFVWVHMWIGGGPSMPSF